LSTVANCWPSWTRVSLVAAGVFPLKNVTQFFVIAATAAVVPVAAGVEATAAGLEAAAVGEGGAVVGAAEDVVAEAAGEAGAELLLELLEQAVTAAASARPITGISRPRRAG
jgi:hypothetical protein